MQQLIDEEQDLKPNYQKFRGYNCSLTKQIIAPVHWVSSGVLKVFWTVDHFTKVKNRVDHQSLKSLCTANFKFNLPHMFPYN